MLTRGLALQRLLCGGVVGEDGVGQGPQSVGFLVQAGNGGHLAGRLAPEFGEGVGLRRNHRRRDTGEIDDRGIRKAVEPLFPYAWLFAPATGRERLDVDDDVVSSVEVASR